MVGRKMLQLTFYALLTVATANSAVAEFLDLPDYLKFPQLFSYDDFEDCRRHYEDYVYCIVKAPLKADDTSPLWRNLSYFSSDYRHYDHTVLERGICLPRCLESLGDMSGRRDRTELFRECINREISPQYDLTIAASLRVEHCYSSATDGISFDILDILFVIVSAAIVMLVFCSTAYDMREQAKQHCPDDYYSSSPKSSRQRLLTAFSLPRNFRRLKDPNNTQTRTDLACFEAFRFIQTCRVIFLHVTIAHLKIPQRNPDFVEHKQHTPGMVTFVAEFQNYVQTFFALSGMLLTINFLDHIRKHPTFQLSYYFERLLNRMCRLIPAYAFMILLEASVTRHLIEGPFGEQFIGESSQNCRRWWWANLLFINNYMATDEPCFIPSWYLATDLQLYMFGLAMLMVFWKWPACRKYVFGLVFVHSVVSPVLVYLGSNITPVMTINLKDTEKYIRHQRFQNELYFPFHLNTGVYFCGIAAGYVYHHFRGHGKDLFNSSIFRHTAHGAGYLYVICMTTVSWIVSNLSWIPSIVLAIYASAFKISWGLFNTVILVALALLPRKNWWKMLLGHPTFSVLGKVGYCVYLIHFTVIVQVYGREKQPIFSNERVVAGFVVEILFWSYLFGVLMCLLIEQPSSTALKELLERKQRKPAIREVHMGPERNADEVTAVAEPAQ